MSLHSLYNRIRPDIRAMTGYVSARSLVQQGMNTEIFLDANESPYSPLPGLEGYNRYAGQQPPDLVEAIAGLYEVTPDALLVSRGADEAIDVLTRLFCRPGQDTIIICPPTFAMYEHTARLNGTAVIKVPLRKDFSLDADAVISAVTADTKIIYLCSPGNPTGRMLDLKEIAAILTATSGRALVVMDEAYIEFAKGASSLPLVSQFDHLAVLRTLSKAHALAGLRCGAVIAHPFLIAEARKILPPYPLPVSVINTVLKVLSPQNQNRLTQERQQLLATRDWFQTALKEIAGVEKVYPSDTNFLLVGVSDAAALYTLCRNHGIFLRNVSAQPGLENCLRISIGTRPQMEALIELLKTGRLSAPPSGRQARVKRVTHETAIAVEVKLDQAGPVHIRTGIGFYDHMWEQVARHGGFALTLDCIGDLQIDTHHTVEDCALAVGQAIREALGNKEGIARFGFTLPMDETLAQIALDLSGRAFCKFEGRFPDSRAGELSTEMIPHIFRSVADSMQATIHIKVEGENTHHMVEACFKVLGRALRQAIRVEGDALPSTKGIL